MSFTCHSEKYALKKNIISVLFLSNPFYSGNKQHIPRNFAYRIKLCLVYDTDNLDWELKTLKLYSERKSQQRTMLLEHSSKMKKQC